MTSGWRALSAYCLGAIATAPLGLLAQELPAKADAREMQKEAGTLIDGLPILSEAPPIKEKPNATLSILSVEQEQVRLEQARRKQQRWEKLARLGVLSKAEAEQSLLEVSTAIVRFERARLARAQSEWENATQRAAAGQADKSLVESAETALKTSRELAASAEAQWNRTRLNLAQVNAERYRRLYAEHLVTKTAMERAQNALLKIQTQAVPVVRAPGEN